ncbi:MAG: hypothetical protein HFE47_01430 [Clostridia bacterium]|nr:hypothetical protein [Clostridia bacterium]
MKKETKKEIGGYVMSNLTILVFSLIFSLLALIFIIDKIPKWLQFVISFVFMAPVFFIVFSQGKNRGERIFKEHAKTTLDNIHGEQAIEIPYHKCVYHVIGFVSLMLIFCVLATALKNTVLRMFVFIFEFPAVLLFSSVGALALDVVTPVTLAIFIPYTLIEAGMFVLGYFFQIRKLRRRHADIENEIRMFDN